MKAEDESMTDTTEKDEVRQISVLEITSQIKEMCIEANHFLSKDMEQAIRKAEEKEESGLAKQILEQLCENMKI